MVFETRTIHPNINSNLLFRFSTTEAKCEQFLYKASMKFIKFRWKILLETLFDFSVR
jgi:hypothetical protein